MAFPREKTIIILTVLIDVIGVGIVVPVLPHFVQSVGASPLTITSLFAAFSLCSFLSAPILGALSDRFGRRPALIASLASTSLGWFVFAGARSIPLLFLGRIIDGLAAGNFPLAQGYMADLSRDAKERTHNMGLIGAVFGIGFIIGPILGALLSQISLAFPFYAVGALAAFNTVAAYFFLPETNRLLARDRKISLNPFAPLGSAWSDARLRGHYAALFLFGLAVSVQQSIFALYLEASFGFGVAATGWVMAAMGGIMLVNQAYLLKHFWLKRFQESQLEVWLFLLSSAGFLAMAMPSLAAFALGLFFMMVSQSVLRAVLSSRITGFAAADRRGEVAGVMSSLMTLGMIIGPLAVGSIYGLNRHWPFAMSSLLLLAAFFVIRRASHQLAAAVHAEEAPPIEVL